VAKAETRKIIGERVLEVILDLKCSLNRM